MLLRHLFKSDTLGGKHDPILHSTINAMISRRQGYLFAGVDSLNAMIDQKLMEAANAAGDDAAIKSQVDSGKPGAHSGKQV